jgi:hypothetical protein
MLAESYTRIRKNLTEYCGGSGQPLPLPVHACIKNHELFLVNQKYSSLALALHRKLGIMIMMKQVIVVLLLIGCQKGIHGHGCCDSDIKHTRCNDCCARA